MFLTTGILGGYTTFSAFSLDAVLLYERGALGLAALYVFLYAPILYVIYTSFAADIVWPFPPSFTLIAYEDLFASSLYGEALANSLTLAAGSAALSTLLAGAGYPVLQPWFAKA